MKKLSFVCTECDKTYDINSAYPRCESCGEPLEVEMISKGRINEGNELNQTLFERYADFLPFTESNNSLSLKEGFTPLVESQSLARDLNVGKIYLKNETQNPTWSFKDRGTVMGVMHAVSSGFKRIGTVSTGNMAVSVAAYGARAGLETFILVGSNMPQEKLNPISVYGPHLIKVEGDYSSLYYESLNIGKRNDIYFINSDVPFRVEGSKTIAFEICEQLCFQGPDYVIVPTSAGGNIRGIIKGFEEFKMCGLIDRVPVIICAQASGCSPIYNAYVNNENKISRVANPHTIAHAIENPFPPSGNEVLRKVAGGRGMCVAVTDEEILEAQRKMAEEGMFGQPASAVPLSAVKKLKGEGHIGEKSTIVCVATGSGLKYTSILDRHNFTAHSCKLEELDEMIGGII